MPRITLGMREFADFTLLYHIYRVFSIGNQIIYCKKEEFMI